MIKVIGNFALCAGCSRKEIREGLGKGKYYCRFVDGIIQNGIVTNDIDATECVRKGLYRSYSL